MHELQSLSHADSNQHHTSHRIDSYIISTSLIRIIRSRTSRTEQTNVSIFCTYFSCQHAQIIAVCLSRTHFEDLQQKTTEPL